VNAAAGPVPYRSARTLSGWSLPGAQRLAVWVIPNVEFFPLDRAIPGSGGHVPDVPAFAVRDYGARVGFWRLLDALTEFEIEPTIALNSDVCTHYPEIADAIAEAGYEVLAHGRTNSRRLSDMSVEQERDTIENVTETCRRRFGAAPRGWLGPGLQESWQTLDLLAEAGYGYVADWCMDDRPDVARPHGLVTVPYSYDANDKVAIDTRNMDLDRFTGLVARQVDVLLREGEQEARVLGIALHPYVVGVPHRIDAVRRMLERLRGLQGVWWCTGSAIAETYRATAHRPGG
jgi:allantoinase